MSKVIYNVERSEHTLQDRDLVFDLYEDGAGMLRGYVSRSGEVVWSKLYYHAGCEADAAADFIAVAEGGQDPVAEGWDGDGLDPEEPVLAGLDLIASTDWREGGFESMFDPRRAGVAGKAFMRLAAPGMEGLE